MSRHGICGGRSTFPQRIRSDDVVFANRNSLILVSPLSLRSGITGHSAPGRRKLRVQAVRPTTSTLVLHHRMSDQPAELSLDTAPDPSYDQHLAECEKRINYVFKNRSILLRALTHSSRATTRLDCNERMEFLGDAVLGLTICEHLFDRFPDRREGQLTQQKSHLVSRTVCAVVCERLKLHELILVGKGLRHIPSSMKAATVESIIASIYIDGGFEEAKAFVLWAFTEELESSHQVDTDNYKSLLQEETQRHGRIVPCYKVVEHRGPDHAREFCVAVSIGEQQFDSAWGRSKKEAEQKAARIAWDEYIKDRPEEGETKSRAAVVRPPAVTDLPVPTPLRPGSIRKARSDEDLNDE